MLVLVVRKIQAYGKNTIHITGNPTSGRMTKKASRRLQNPIPSMRLLGVGALAPTSKAGKNWALALRKCPRRVSHLRDKVLEGQFRGRRIAVLPASEIAVVLHRAFVQFVAAVVERLALIA